MAYSTPSTRSTGDLITAAIWNQDVVDNVIALKADSTPLAIVQIDTDELSADGTFSFTGIAATFAHLKVLVYARSDRAADNDAINLNFNTDTGNNYDYIIGNFNTGGWAAVGARAQAAARVGIIAGATAVANAFDAVIIDIPHYANTANHKTVKASSSFKVGVGGDDELHLTDSASWWRSTAAIASIQITPNTGTDFKDGSRAELYGCP